MKKESTDSRVLLRGGYDCLSDHSGLCGGAGRPGQGPRGDGRCLYSGGGYLCRLFDGNGRSCTRWPMTTPSTFPAHGGRVDGRRCGLGPGEPDGAPDQRRRGALLSESLHPRGTAGCHRGGGDAQCLWNRSTAWRWSCAPTSRSNPQRDGADLPQCRGQDGVPAGNLECVYLPVRNIGELCGKSVLWVPT